MREDDKPCQPDLPQSPGGRGPSIRSPRCAGPASRESRQLLDLKFCLLYFYPHFFRLFFSLTCGPGSDAQAPGHGPQQTRDAGDALVSVALTCRLDDGRSGIGKNIL